MTALTVTYPASEDSWFKHDYYMDKHVGLIRGLWADLLEGVDVYKGVEGMRGQPVAYHVIAVLRFKSAEALKQAFTLPEAAGLSADIANFTNVAPRMQINEPVR